MLQFNPQQIKEIRTRVSVAQVQKLIEENHTVLENDVLVSPDARATWNLYYYCDEHGVRLEWDRHNSKEHCCPIDGKVFTGEPYDGAWWRWLNTLNSRACYQLGLLWQLTQERHYFEKVRTILLQYAHYYPDYEVHGGIPYNGPGKANAQTLCEANCHLDFARGYDFISDDLDAADKTKIERQLLREGAEFLMEHRSEQLHNHEMKINATIGVIGLLLDDPAYLDFALHSKYGLHYQLDNGCLGEGMWFEGSIHYHYYALQAVLAYEKIACGTVHSVASNNNLIKMLKFPLNLILGHGNFPRMNDCIAGQEKLNHTHIFEFANKQFPCLKFQQVLQSIYSKQERDNLDALLYGVDSLDSVERLQCQTVHAPYSGYTLGSDNIHNNAFLLKHAPYGGEHDHYDRLGLILVRNGKEILPDLGTTGYGAHLHYHYYKNSATHNTLVVNQSNQSPNAPKLLNFSQEKDHLLVDSIADWREAQPSVDSHVIEQWDSASYKDIVFRRVVLWFGNLAIEINRVHNPNRQQLDLTYHVRGEHILSLDWVPVDNPLSGALTIMRSCHRKDSTQYQVMRYQISGESDFSQTIATDSPCELLIGEAPDNPATKNMAYLLVRSRERNFSSLVMHDLSQDLCHQLSNVRWEGEESVYFDVRSEDEVRQVKYSLSAGTVTVTLLTHAQVESHAN
ncbi:heparinase II/III domain-containing protein [Vibrio algarum]|uniref:Heparinase II/III family protein n=1 Tax=Vibrio algarum TaxID=3020714 RepID=A0ABT4YUX0_9VIBR|nr:heparinase II/III family protein [Vibrio sp. KJ40-1]MDB1125377.1 heparinase II/III family protein [Vibrio sp. KJ40-1]